jgi:hypothetical protein
VGANHFSLLSLNSFQVRLENSREEPLPSTLTQYLRAVTNIQHSWLGQFHVLQGPMPICLPEGSATKKQTEAGSVSISTNPWSPKPPMVKRQAQRAAPRGQWGTQG